jgi:GTPase SAR1 family protein
VYDISSVASFENVVRWI